MWKSKELSLICVTQRWMLLVNRNFRVSLRVFTNPQHVFSNYTDSDLICPPMRGSSPSEDVLELTELLGCKRIQYRRNIVPRRLANAIVTTFKIGSIGGLTSPTY